MGWKATVTHFRFVSVRITSLLTLPNIPLVNKSKICQSGIVRCQMLFSHFLCYKSKMKGLTSHTEKAKTSHTVTSPKVMLEGSVRIRLLLTLPLVNKSEICCASHRFIHFQKATESVRCLTWHLTLPEGVCRAMYFLRFVSQSDVRCFIFDL